MLEIKGLEVAYGDAQVLWGVDLTVAPGEIAALVGSNGAGKTTFLATVSGLVAPLRGSITWEGSSLVGVRPDAVVARGIVHVPEGRLLFPGMTVEENLLMGGYTRGRQARGELERVYGYFPILAERRRQLAGKLSGGEQQMCAIGRGLMARPRLMMMDEVSLGLSPVVTEKLFEIVQQINREGVTILLVEQDVQLALEIAHRGYVLERGKVVLSGPAHQLLSDDSVRAAYLGL